MLAAALAAVADGENYLPVQCLECYHLKHVFEISSLSDHVFSIQGADSQDQSKAWDLATLRSLGVKRRLYQRKLLVAHFVLLMHRFSFRHLMAEVHQAGATIW